MPPIVDISGQRFGRLRAVRIDHRKGPRTFWLCACDCGEAAVVVLGSLRNGDTRSCGCLRTEQTSARARTHGNALPGAVTTEYRAWQSMRRRCVSETGKDYPLYGGRGICVCRRWASFDLFLLDMGKKPSQRHSLDRIDVNGNYEPGNVRWADPRTQANNKRTSVRISLDGVTRTVPEWSALTGISKSAIYRRRAVGWATKSILTKRTTGESTCL